MVFRENSELGAFLSGGYNELGGFGEVLFWLEGLRGAVRAVVVVGWEDIGGRPRDGAV